MDELAVRRPRPADREGEQLEFQVHGLPRQPCNRGVMTAERLGDRSAALALGQSLQRLGLLVVTQLELAAEPDAALDGGDAAPPSDVPGCQTVRRASSRPIWTCSVA